MRTVYLNALKPNTRSLYARAIRHFEALMHKPPEEATLADIEQFHRQLLDRLKYSSARTYTMAIGGYIGWLYDMGLRELPSGWRQLARRLREPRSPRRALSDEEVQRLLRAARGRPSWRRDVLLIETILILWLRRSELAAMRFEHFRRRGRQTVLWLPHTKRGTDDWVPVPEQLHERLVVELGREGYGETTGPVWRSAIQHVYQRRALSEESIRFVTLKIGRDAGLEGITPHVLRHTGITMAMRMGVPIDRIKRMARHGSISTTMRYVHDLDYLREAPSLVLADVVRRLEETS